MENNNNNNKNLINSKIQQLFSIWLTQTNTQNLVYKLIILD